jgi:hypothetical protein
MSEQGLETTTPKTHKCIARVAEALHVEKRDAYATRRAVLRSLFPALALAA